MYPGEAEYSTPPQRPTSVTVIAIIAIVIGGLGILCCTPASIFPYVSSGGAPNPIVEMTKAKPLLFGWTIFMTVVSFVLYVVLLVAGIGALGLKNWARLLLMAEAALSIVLQLVGLVVSTIVLLPMLRGLGSGPEATGVMVGVGAGACFTVVILGYKAAVLFLMTRPNVKAAFGA